MRHRVRTTKIGTDTNHRKAIIKGLVLSLITHGSIETTVTKAKEASRVADKLIGKARVDSVPTRRLLHSFFGKRDAVNTLVERVAPAFTKRVSGFTRVVSVGTRRGDNTPMARVSLVVQPDSMGSLKKPAAASDKTTAKAESASKTAKPAKKTTATKAATKPKTTATKTTATKTTTKVATKRKTTVKSKATAK